MTDVQEFVRGCVMHAHGLSAREGEAAQGTRPCLSYAFVSDRDPKGAECFLLEPVELGKVLLSSLLLDFSLLSGFESGFPSWGRAILHLLKRGNERHMYAWLSGL